MVGQTEGYDELRVLASLRKIGKALQRTEVRPLLSRRSLLGVGAASVLSSSMLAGCATARGPAPDLRFLYNRSAQYHRPDRNPIIVIPGLLGSRLRDPVTSAIVWGAFDGDAANPTDGAGARALAAPLEADGPFTDPTVSVQADGVLDRLSVNVAGIPLELAQYAQILATLGAGGYRDESLGLAGVDYGGDHFTCFQFAYDWRLDNAQNAVALKRFMDEKRVYVAEKYAEVFGTDTRASEIKFDVVAHSMGALLLRYFMRYGDQQLEGEGPHLDWRGASYFDRAVFVAPPNAGTALTLLYLTEGRDFGRPILPFYPPAILGTYASLYQMLPRPRHQPVLWGGDAAAPLENLFDPVIWRRYEWGLAAPDQDRVRAQLLPTVTGAADRLSIATVMQERLLRKARAFAAALDRPAGRASGVEAMLVAGDALRTPQTLSMDEQSGRLFILDYGPGDGTVLRSSALLDERSDESWTPTVQSPLRFNSTLLLPGDHLGLTRSSAFSDNVLYWLLEDVRDRSASTANL